MFLIARQRTQYAERDIVLPIPSVIRVGSNDLGRERQDARVPFSGVSPFRTNAVNV